MVRKALLRTNRAETTGQGISDSGVHGDAPDPAGSAGATQLSDAAYSARGAEATDGASMVESYSNCG